jgi:mannose-1-phosphate guanylyltransferase
MQIAPGVWVGLNTSIDWTDTVIEGPVYIGSGVRVEAGSRIIGPTWIGHGSHICSGSTIIRSVLFEYTRVLPDVSLDEMIVFKDYSVDRAGVMRHVSECTTHEWNNARDRRNRPRTGVQNELQKMEEVRA